MNCFKTKIKIYIYVAMLVVCFGATKSVQAADVYFSVGQNTTDHRTCTDNDCATNPLHATVSGTTITFDVAQTASNFGVGDKITYDGNICYISGKTSTAVWNCISVTGGTPMAASDATVSDISHVFSSLADAVNDTPLGTYQLVSNDYTLHLPCYYDTGVDTVPASINSAFQTDATHYIKIYTPNDTQTEVNVSQRHRGVWNSSKYSLEVTAGANNDIALDIHDADFVKVEGLQVKMNTGAYTTTYGIYSLAASGMIEIDEVIVELNTSSTSGYGIDLYENTSSIHVRNSLVYATGSGTGARGILNRGGSGSIIFNCTVIGSQFSRGIWGYTAGNVTAINNIVRGSADGFYGTFAAASDYNSSSISGDAPNTGGSGNDNTASPWYSGATADSAIFFNPIGYNYHLSPGSIFINTGDDLSGIFTTDIDGDTRVDTWDIGADEMVPVEFVSIVDPGNGAGTDYTSLSAWEAGVQTDLTSVATKVFSHGGKTGTVGDNASVTGATSGATATVVHATATQILLENISGTFQSGEQVRVDVSNYVTISNAGDSAIAVATCRTTDGSADTTAVTIDGWTTNETNYVKIWTDPNDQYGRHEGKWDDTKYRLELNLGSTSDARVLSGLDPYIKIQGLQISHQGTGDDQSAIYSEPGYLERGIEIDSCIIKHVGTIGDYTGIYGISGLYADGIKVYNTLIYDYLNSNDGTNAAGIFDINTQNTYVSNVTIVGCSTGLLGYEGAMIAKNVLVSGHSPATQAFSGTFISASDYNASDDNSAPGANSRHGQTFSFVDAANDDFHLASNDAGARNYGTDLSADANLSVTNDIDNITRPGESIFDIGADEYTPPKPVYFSVGQSTANLMTGTPNVTITNGVATFSVAQTGNIGVGDVIVVGANSYYISGKTSTTIWNVTTATGSVPADITSTAVTSIGRVYTSLASAEAGAPTLLGTSDLVTANIQLNFPCYYDTAADTAAVTIDGYTTGENNYIKIYTPNNTTTEVNNSQRHSGKWDDGKYRIVISTDIDPAIDNRVSYTVIDGLQIISTTYASEYSYGIRVRYSVTVGDVSEVTIKNNIIREGNNSQSFHTGIAINATVASPIYILNNVIYGFNGTNGAGITASTDYPGTKYHQIYNNTVYNCTTGVVTQYGDSYAKNNLVAQCADAFAGNFRSGSDYNATDIDDDTVGELNLSAPNDRKLQTFSFLDVLNNDYHLASTDTAAKNFGVDLSADANLPFSTDIDGAPRNVSINQWDIGADETATQIFRSVGPGATGLLESDTAHARNVTLTSGVATFSVALADNIGVGDVLIYDNDASDTITSVDTLLFIHGRTDSTHYTVRTQTGAIPDDMSPIDNDTWQIYRAHTSLANAEAGTINSTLSTMGFAQFNGGNRDLVANNEQWNIAAYANGTTADATVVSVDGWISGLSNYVRIYTPVATSEVGTSQRHNGKWDDSKYRIEGNYVYVVNLYSAYTKVQGLQVNVLYHANYATMGISSMGTTQNSRGLEISSNIVKNSSSQVNVSGISVYHSSGVALPLYIYNNIVYDFTTTGARGIAVSSSGTALSYVYNNTVNNCNIGISGTYSLIAVLKNNIVNNSLTYDYDLTAHASSSYNISSDTTAPGTNSKTLTTVNFADVTNKDFHLASSDIAAKNAGTDLSTDTNLRIISDIDGVSRNASINAWDIGADETATQVYRSVGPGATGILESDTSHTRNVTVTGGTATFNVALQDNVGVGDAVLIDTNNDNSITSADSLLFISGRNSSTSYNLQTNDGAVPSDITINDTYQIYRAYTSLSLAEAGTRNTSIPMAFNGGNRDLIVNNEQWNIACYANGTTADTTAVTIDGWDTGEQSFIKVYTPVSTSEVGVSQRHNGKWDDGKYYLMNTAQWTSTINSHASYVFVDGLQIYSNALSSEGISVFNQAGLSKNNSNIKISNNIVKSINSGNGGIYLSTNIVAEIYNNIVYNFGWSCIRGATWDNFSDYYINNNTVYGCERGYANFGNLANTLALLKNNIEQNSSILGYGSGSGLSLNNISSDGTAPGTNSKINTTVDFVDTTNYDFHLAQTDTAARGAGANLANEIPASARMTDDIDGQLRNPVGTGWDIGADEGTVEFTPLVTQGGVGGDYGSLNAWEAGVQTDLIASTTRVFAHGGITGTIADNASVSGVTSGATATVVHATTNQILLENISGIFQSGEVVQVTAGNSVTISDNGNPASAVAKIDGAWSIDDTTATEINGSVTGADNYIRIYTTPTARHTGKWDDGKYRLVTNSYFYSLRNADNYIRIDGLQISNTATNGRNCGISPGDIDSTKEHIITNNIVKKINAQAVSSNVGISVIPGQHKIVNNIVYGFNTNYLFHSGGSVSVAGSSAAMYNNTSIDALTRGYFLYMYGSNDSLYLKNNIDQGSAVGYLFDSAITTYDHSNNISEDATSPDGASYQNKVVTFVDEANFDFHLAQSDTAAKDAGVDLSAEIPAFAGMTGGYDIDGQTRNASISAWDIGADETATQIFRSVGPGNTTALATDNSHVNNVTLTSGLATFNVALPDNVGVGDAVIIDTAGTADAIDASDTILFIQERISSTNYKLQTTTGAIPSDIPVNDTYSIFRAYTSLANAEAGTKNTSIPMTFTGGNRDLATNNEQWNIACYANGTAADTDETYIDGWITSENNYIKVYTPVSTSEVGVTQRHDGKWDTTKYRIEVASVEASGIRVLDDYIKIVGLQITVSDIPDSGRNAIMLATGGGHLHIESNIIKGKGGADGRGIYFVAHNGPTYVFNNIIYDWDGTGNSFGIWIETAGTTKSYVYNNTVYNSTTGINDYGTDIIAKNNIVQSCADGYSGTFNASSDYNISDLASDAPGANSKNSTTVNFMDATNNDFHLAFSDTAAKNAGVDLSADSNLAFQDDIDGDHRDMNWSIGADEGTETMVQTPAPSPTENPNLDINTGLVGYWSFDGETVSGTEVKDLSGNNNNGTINNASLEIGKRGQGIDMGSAGDSVIIPDSANLDGMSELTLSAWVKPRTYGIGTTYGRIVDKQNITSYTFHANSSNISCELGAQSANTNTNPFSGHYNEWHHLMCVYDGAAINIYFDGALVATSPKTGNIGTSTGNLVIGNNATGDRTWNGGLDEVRIYNRALEVDEVGHLYRMGEDKFQTSQTDKLTDGLVGMWSFDGPDVSGVTAYDRSGNGNNGTIVGATPVMGKKGQAMDFNGTTSYINAGSAASLDDIENQGGGGMTVSAWIKPRTSGEGGQGVIACKSEISGGTLGSWGFYVANAGLPHVSFFKDYDGATSLSAQTINSSITLNNWQLVTVTWNGGSVALTDVKFYINGVLSTHGFDSNGVGNKIADTSNQYHIGTDRWGSNTFSGQIDELRVYNRILSGEEIDNLFRLGQTKIKD